MCFLLCAFINISFPLCKNEVDDDVCTYVCMQYLIDVTDAHQKINIKSSQNDVQYKAAKLKTISLDKAIYI